MSSRIAWLIGSSAAPNTPCSNRKPTISPRLVAIPQSPEATVKPRIETEHQPLAAEASGEPAGERRRDGGGHDVGGEHPGDLIARRRDAALDVRQRDIGDRRVERIHQRRRHHRDGDEQPRRGAGQAVGRVIGAAAAAALGAGSGRRRTDDGDDRCRPSTDALRPACSGRSAGPCRASSSTGSRCVTFTQLPVAFSGGSSEKVLPVPGLKFASAGLQLQVGKGVELHRRRLAEPHVAQLVFLEVRLDPEAVPDQGEDRLRGVHIVAHRKLIDLGDDAVLGGADNRVVEIRASPGRARPGLRGRSGFRSTGRPASPPRLASTLAFCWTTVSICWRAATAARAAVSYCAWDEMPSASSSCCRSRSRSAKCSRSCAAFSSEAPWR